MAVHADDVPAFLAALQAGGLVEPIDPSAWPVDEGDRGDIRPYNGRSFDLEGGAGTFRRCLSILDAHAPERGGLKALFSPKTALTLQGLADGFHNFPLEEVAEKVRVAEAELQRISAEEARLEQWAETLEPWRDVDVRLSDLSGLRSVRVTLAEGAPGSQGRVMLALGAAADRVHVETVSSGKKAERFLLVYLMEESEAVEAALGEADVSVSETPAPPPGSEEDPVDWGATPSEIMDRLKGLRRELEKARQDVVGGVRDLAVYREGLQAASDYVDILKARKDAEDWLVRVGGIALGMGWVLEDRKGDLEKLLRKSVPQVHVEFLENGPEDSPPVFLENAALVQPFSVVTRLYGLPRPVEADPTPLLAPFFFVFFGLCLSDSGYGIVLALLFWFGLRRIHLGSMGRDFFRLIMFGGLSALVFGAFAGSWMGNTLELLPGGLGFLKQWADKAVVLDPIKNPVPFLVLALGLGVVQIYVGLIAKLAARVKGSGLREALLDEGVEIFLLSGFLFLGLAAGGVLPASSVPAAQWTALAAAAVTVVARGRAYTNVFAKIGGGLLGIYAVVNYLGDILSYSRLFALGLATSVIAVVVNTFMGLLGEVPIVGVVLMPLVFLAGHFFNLVISSLGAFIHSARLQYVEFFSKFYGGGGRAFSPFRLATRYVEVEA